MPYPFSFFFHDFIHVSRLVKYFDSGTCMGHRSPKTPTRYYIFDPSLGTCPCVATGKSNKIISKYYHFFRKKWLLETNDVDGYVIMKHFHK